MIRSKGIIINVQSIKNGVVNYIMFNPNHDLAQNKHRLRFKETLFGEIYTYYHPDMNFSHCTILNNNRK